MPGWAREDHLVVEEGLESNGAVPSRRADEPELELARRDALDDGLRVRNGQRNLDAGVRALELAKEQGHDDCGGTSGGTELQLAGELALALAGELVQQLLLEGEQP